MTTTNLSGYHVEDVPPAKGMSFGIVVSEWNPAITGRLLEGALNTLKKHGVAEKDILVKKVPGSFELTAGSVALAENTNVESVICLGCVIRGETPHFDYICQGVSVGITNLNIQYGIPFIFGVLTTIDQQQAIDRAGGKHGNKGDEAAVTAIKMVALKRSLAAK